MNNIDNKQKVTYCDTEYQDFADYNGSLKKLWESLKNSATESIESSWKRQWALVSKLNKPLDQPVWIREYLAWKKFYSQMVWKRASIIFSWSLNTKLSGVQELQEKSHFSPYITLLIPVNRSSLIISVHRLQLGH